MAIKTGWASSLSLSEVDELFDGEHGTVDVLNRPVGGDVFIVRGKSKEDWRADGYRWRQNGTVKIPKKEPRYAKLHFLIITPDGESRAFTKYAYRKLHDDSDQRVVIHYVGDSSAYTDFPHGNSRKKNNYVGAPSSTKSTMKTTTCDFKDLLLQSGDGPVHFQPRNPKQLQYFQSLDTNKLGRDALVNLHEIAYMLPSFVWSIQTFPDLSVCCGLQQLADVCAGGCLLSYDTTFCLGDFYLSCLVTSCEILQERPIVPIAFVLHERKFESVHEQFFRLVQKQLPALRHCQIVTDGEAGIVRAIETAVPDWQLIACRNHILSDVEFWLKKHHGNSAEIAAYKAQVYELLQSETEEQLQVKTDTMKSTRSQAFEQYFSDHIQSRVDKAYTGYLTQCGLPSTGVTTNSSESLNAMLKRLQDWKEVTSDLMLLSLYKLQLYFVKEIERACNCVGTFSIHSSADVADIKTVVDANLPTPEEIVDSIRTAVGSMPTSEPVPPVVHALAACTRVSHVPEQRLFTVEMPDGAYHACRLFPTESCTCPARAGCCHLAAAKRSVGIDNLDRRTINLSQLRRNSRKRHDKKSGRKKPRVADVTFVAAPDSSAHVSGMEEDTLAPSPDKLCDLDPGACFSNGRDLCTEMTEDDVPGSRPMTKEGTSTSTPATRKRVHFSNDTTLPSPIAEDRDETRVKKTCTSRARKRLQLHKQVPGANNGAQATSERNSKASQPARPTATVDLTSTVDVKPSGVDDCGTVWLESPRLYTSDRCDLEEGRWLNDRIMNAAQCLLHKEFPDARGLHDTVTAGRGSEPVNADLGVVQCFHDGPRQHWLTISTRHCVENVAMVYCCSQDVPSGSCIKAVTTFIKFPGNRVTFRVMNVAKQNGGSDCGLFSIAYATAILYGADPVNCVFDQSAMRQHLIHCLCANHITPFPISSNRAVRHQYSRVSQVTLYCICRTSYEATDGMLKCSKCSRWFHFECMHMSRSSFDEHIADKSKPFRCRQCVQ